MEKTLSPFGIPNAYCLYDDYSSDFFIEVKGIRYPSVRHAVLSFKTADENVKKELSTILLPSDLKDYELAMPTPQYWSRDYVLRLMKVLTLKKFKERNDFWKVLEATGEVVLEDIRFTDEKVLDIEEVATLPNYRGKILMQVREKLTKQKAP